MTKPDDINILRRHFLIGAIGGLAGVILLLADARAARAGGGGGGGAEPGDRRATTKPLTPEARTKLRKLRDLAKKTEADVKRGKRSPLTSNEKMILLGVLEQWAPYKETPEFQDALWAVWDANNATGPR